MFNEAFPFYLVQVFCNVSVYLFFAIKTFESSLRFKRKFIITLAVIYALFSISVIELFVEEISPFQRYKLPAFCIWVAVSALFCGVAFTTHPVHILFFVLVVFNLNSNIALIARAACRIRPLLLPTENFQYLSATILFLVLMLPLLWNLFIRQYRQVICLKFSNTYWKYLFLLPLSYFLFCNFGTGYMIEDAVNPWYCISTLLLLNICYYLSMTAVLEMLLKTYDSLRAEENEKLAEQMLEMEKEQYKNIAVYLEHSAQKRHDLRHHMAIIGELAREKDFDGLTAYLAGYQDTWQPLNEGTICGNHIVDLVVRHYKGIAVNHDIRVNVSIELPEIISVSDVELCAVFGNLLENAVESCLRQPEGERFLEIKARMISDSTMALFIKNSCEEKPLPKGEAFLSSKREGPGIGVTSVRAIVEKNGGDCRFVYDEKEFKVYILLNI